MILSDSVVNSFGQTLLNAGISVGLNHRKILKTWNVSYVSIKSDLDVLDDEINPELLKIATENLQSRMNWEPILPIEIDLFKTSVLNHAVKSRGKI
jgi:hypothetical protein